MLHTFLLRVEQNFCFMFYNKTLIKPLLKVFNIIYNNTLLSLISLTLCDTLGVEFDTISDYDILNKKYYDLPRMKSTTWVARLKWHMKLIYITK